MSDPVNPAHYKRGPVFNFIGPDGKPMKGEIEAIDVIRCIPDARLANAMKYIWRVGFGGKEDDAVDIEKAVWYLNDYLRNPVV
jgi:hypothetical protein